MQEPVTVVGGSVLAEAIVVMAVTSVRKVTRAHRPCADPELNGALMDLGEASIDVPLSPGRGATVASPTAVVVAGQKDLPPSQFSHHGQRVGDLSKGEVTEHPDVVAGIHGLVPSLDEGAIHRVGVGEGPIGVVDDVGMAEMEIGSEPHRHDFNVGICLVRAPAHFARPRWRARRSLVGLRPEPPSLNSWRVLETQLTWEAAGYTDLPFS